MVLEIEVIIPPSVSLGWRGVRTERLMNHAGNQKFRYDVSIGVTQNHIVLHDLFAGKNHRLRSKGGLAHDSEVPPRVGVALLVCPLDMKDSHVGADGANGQQRFVDRKSTRLNSSHLGISYAVFCLKKKKKNNKYINDNALLGGVESRSK